jgi:hypothetical protein
MRTKKKKRLAATRIHGLHFPQGGVNVEKRRDEKLRKPDSRVSILGKKDPCPQKTEIERERKREREREYISRAGSRKSGVISK